TSQDEVGAAMADAHKVKGVREVHNELQIVSACRVEEVKARDKDLKKAIESAMKGDSDLKHVGINVNNGVAHLTGTVSSDWERMHAATLARSLRGVRSVQDDIRVNKE